MKKSGLSTQLSLSPNYKGKEYASAEIAEAFSFIVLTEKAFPYDFRRTGTLVLNF